MRRVLYLLALSLMALSLIVPSAGAQQAQTATVNMRDNYFDQANITVPAGTTVTWVQSGNNSHTTTSYDGLWDSGLLPAGSGQTFSFTFNTPGTYRYFCRPHEAVGMVGTVTVTGGGDTTAAAQPSMPTTSGPSLLLPAAALLMGSGVLGWTVLRRRSSS